MSFVDLPDGTGKIYVPEKKQGGGQKHPCPDCFSCQLCSDERCQRCLGRGQRQKGRCCCRGGTPETEEGGERGEP
jgi:hypothetical protein